MLRIFRQLYTIRNIFFILAEAFFIYLSVIVTSYILLPSSEFSFDVWLNYKALIISSVCIVCLYYNNVYDIAITKNYSELSIRLMQAFGASLIILAGIYMLFSDVMICRGFFLIYLPIVMALISAWRFLYITILQKGFLNEKIILIGSGEICQGIMDKIHDQIDCGFTLVAVVEESGNGKKLTIHDPGTVRFDGYDHLYTKAKQAEVDKMVWRSVRNGAHFLWMNF